MPLLELPHSHNCVVCGTANPHGLRLSLFVDTDTGAVSTRFTPEPHHMGFEGVIHGGLLATVVDESMAWAATWHARRFCVCAEMTNRYRSPARPGQPLLIEATIASSRPRLITTECTVRDATDHTLLVTSTGKFIPVPQPQSDQFAGALSPHPDTEAAVALLRSR